MKHDTHRRFAIFAAAAMLTAGLVGNAALAQKGKEPAPKNAQEREYLALAQKHKPKNAAEEQKAKARMQLSKDARAKTRKGGRPDAMDYTAYAVCFYAQLAGGASISDAGKDCRDQFLN